MKQFVLFLILIGLIFVGAFAVAKRIHFPNKHSVPPPVMTEKGPFFPNLFPLKNHPFTLVIIGMNNGASVEKTLSSVFRQVYDNFRVIYIDDASKDGSFELARDLIYDSGHILQVTLVHNEETLGVMANLVRAVKACPDEEIIVMLNGEDWLAHEWVLQRLNAYYSNPDLWLTYSQSMEYPTFQIGQAQDLKAEGLREMPLQGQLNTFYAGLFKKVKESDFIYQGKFLPASADLAYMLPMLEMGLGHTQFIPEVLYIANREASRKEDRDLQVRCEKYIRGLTPYKPLAVLKEIHPL